MDREALPADTLGVLCDCAACRGPQPAAAAASSSAQPASFGRVFNPNQFASHAGNRSKKWKLAALVPGFTHSVPVWCYLLYFGLVAPDPPRAYTAGSWGPPAASALVARDGFAWAEEE